MKLVSHPKDDSRVSSSDAGSSEVIDLTITTKIILLSNGAEVEKTRMLKCEDGIYTGKKA